MSQKNVTLLTVEPGESSLTITREFDAPRNLVFRAYSDPELFVRWYGCEKMVTKADLYECRTGGSYRLTQTIDGMGTFSSRGVFHEVLANERIVKTHEGSMRPGRVGFEITRFEAISADRTRVVGTSYFQSVADRDDLVKMGVQKGSSDAHELLRALLEELKRS